MKKEMDVMHKQVEQKERENEELRRTRIQENKEMSGLRKEIHELKVKLSQHPEESQAE